MVLAILAAAVLAGITLFGRGPTELARAIESFFSAAPGLLDWFWEICDTLLIVWAIVLLGSAVVGRRRLGLLRDQVLAAALAAAGAVLVLSEGADLGDALTTTGPPPLFPGARLAIATAVIVVSSPHLGRPVRRVGRWFVFLAAAAGVVLGLATPAGTIAGLALGYCAAAIVHLLFGSPGGRPAPDEVANALGELGIEAREVTDASLAPRGVALMDAEDGEGRGLLVKVYGRDAWDGQLLNTLWSALWYRDDAGTLTLSRLQQVEHEAFVTLLAERAGVLVQPVVAAGTVDADAVLVLERRGVAWSDAPDAAVTDGELTGVWDSLGRLHGAGVAHGTLDGDHLVVDPSGSVVFGGLAAASVAPAAAQLERDRAQLLVTVALRVGVERAVATARDALGPDGLAGLLPYLQPAALTRSSRKAMSAAGLDLDEVRARAAAAAGIDPPKLEPLRRVTWGTLGLVALMALGGWAIISAVSQVGIAALVEELEGIDQGWFWAALVVAQLATVAEAFSTIGASPAPIRLGPAIALQFAIRFIALAVPSSAARVALNVRFFQRVGLGISPAIAVGLVDSVAGFVVQVLLLVIIWISGLATLDLSTTGISIDVSPEVVIGLAILVVVVIAIVALIPKVRRLIGPRLAEARVALQVLRSPTKAFEIFGGNLVNQVILAAALGLSLRAFGYQASLAELVLVNTLASLFAGVMPVPGGVGVTEAAVAAGLVAIGVPEAPAVAAAIVFRIVSFYLPPAWGAYAMRVLRQNEYL